MAGPMSLQARLVAGNSWMASAPFSRVDKEREPQLGALDAGAAGSVTAPATPRSWGDMRKSR